MDTKDIETLLNVIEKGSFAGAARKENLTSAAVSLRIRKLERELGIRLIERRGQTVKPTNNCLEAVPYFQEVLFKIRELSLSFNPQALPQTLRLGAISTAMSDYIPALLHEFSTLEPNINLNVVPGTSEQLFTRVLEDSLDAAFIVNPPDKIPKAINWHLITEQSYVLITHNGDTRPPEEILRNSNLLAYDTSSWGGKPIGKWLKKNYPYLSTLSEMDALETIAICVAQKLGFAIVPAWGGLKQLEGVKHYPLRHSAPVRRIGLIYSSNLNSLCEIVAALYPAKDKLSVSL